LCYLVGSRRIACARLAFMLVGHTKCSCDGNFGHVKRAFRRKDAVETVKQMAKVVGESAKTNEVVNASELQWHDWKGFTGQFFRPITGFRDMQYFTIDVEGGGVWLRAKRMWTHSEVALSISVLKDGVTLEDLQNPSARGFRPLSDFERQRDNIPATRKEYLGFSSGLREFIQDEKVQQEYLADVGWTTEDEEKASGNQEGRDQEPEEEGEILAKKLKKKLFEQAQHISSDADLSAERAVAALVSRPEHSLGAHSFYDNKRDEVSSIAPAAGGAVLASTPAARRQRGVLQTGRRHEVEKGKQNRGPYHCGNCGRTGHNSQRCKEQKPNAQLSKKQPHGKRQ
jgi:hypothetical protein